ncbi:MAG: zinc-binding alcohol dehydrogenase [Provencibacterium sp.]|nr:zinc-binding alcohol dehydrogenase [Provencibacterium sp.]
MKGIRVLFQAPGKACIQEFEVRAPKSNEVIVRVIYSLISSGTEKAYLSCSNNTAQKFPTVPGYSSVGIVEQYGTDVQNFSIGDRVFVSYGGHANYNIKPESSIIKIPDSVSLQEAAFTRLASFPLLALRRAQLEIGESVVIVGLGMLGQFGVQLARIAGGLPVIAVGNREIRKQKALQYGAKFVLSPDDPELTNKIMEYTQITGTGGANVVLETSGQVSALISCLKYTAKHGRVLLNGCNRVTDQPIDLYKYIHLRGVSLIGAHDKTRLPYSSWKGNWTAKRDYMTVLGLLEDGRLEAKSMISELVKPESVSEIYNRLLNDREFPLGVLLDWSESKT